MSVPVTARPVPTGSKPKRSTLRRLLLAGVLFWLPIGVTVWVLMFLIHALDRLVLLLPVSAAHAVQTLDPVIQAGLGLLFALLLLLLTGVLASNLIGRRLVVYGEELLHHIPIVGAVYGGVKSFAESVFSQSSAFRTVVMLEYPRPGIWSIGFLTAEDVPEVSARAGEPAQGPRIQTSGQAPLEVMRA